MVQQGPAVYITPSMAKWEAGKDTREGSVHQPQRPVGNVGMNIRPQQDGARSSQPMTGRSPSQWKTCFPTAETEETSLTGYYLLALQVCGVSHKGLTSPVTSGHQRTKLTAKQ